MVPYKVNYQDNDKKIVLNCFHAFNSQEIDQSYIPGNRYRVSEQAVASKLNPYRCSAVFYW